MKINSKLQWDEAKTGDILVFKNSIGTFMRRRIEKIDDNGFYVNLNGEVVKVRNHDLVRFERR